MSDTLIIIPTYNEIENIEPLTKAVIYASNEVDILIVDDNSPDGTGKKADELESLEPRINVIHRNKKDGLGRAYIEGFHWALNRKYEYIMEMDCDFSHDPKEIENFRKKK